MTLTPLRFSNATLLPHRLLLLSPHAPPLFPPPLTTTTTDATNTLSNTFSICLIHFTTLSLCTLLFFECHCIRHHHRRPFHGRRPMFSYRANANPAFSSLMEETPMKEVASDLENIEKLIRLISLHQPSTSRTETNRCQRGSLTNSGSKSRNGWMGATVEVMGALEGVVMVVSAVMVVVGGGKEDTEEDVEEGGRRKEEGGRRMRRWDGSATLENLDRVSATYVTSGPRRPGTPRRDK